MSKFIVRQFKRFKSFLAIAVAFLIVVLHLTTAPKHYPQPSELIKGVWLSHVGNAFLSYTTLTDNAFHQLSRLNYNRVYVDVYNNGTTYPSKYSPRNHLLSLPFTNPLKKAVKEGKRQGLQIYAWYEHGMMTFPHAKLAQLHPEWILATQNGTKLIDNHWWLDPNNSEVQQYFVNFFTEVAVSYPDLHGIQLDDHWGIPVQFGNKATAMTELTCKINTAIKKTNSELVISLSPNPLGFAQKKYAQNWLTWIEAGLIDELVLQLYRPTSQDIALGLDNSNLSRARRDVDIAVGIYAGGLSNHKPLKEIQQQMAVVRKYGYGYAIFPWKTSLGILRWNQKQEKEKYLKAI